CAARCSVLARFEHQERAERAKRHAAAPRRALPDRREAVLQELFSEREDDQKIAPLAVLRAADEDDVALPRFDARKAGPHPATASRFLPHKGARGTGDAMYDRNIAGKQIRELREEQRGPQVAHQPLVEKRARVRRLGKSGEDRGIDLFVTLAAA